MTLEQQPDIQKIDSDTFVATVLATQFERAKTSADQFATVTFLADAIKAQAKDGLKVISLIGGAASGKSTITRQLVEKLDEIGVTSDAISTDDYVIGDRDYRREHFEGSEPRAKYDFELMREYIDVITKLEDGESLGVPTYDPETGIAIYAGEANYTHRIGKVDVLIVEGDFSEVDKADLTIYLHVPDMQRLQNRIERDRLERGEPRVRAITDNFNLRQSAQHVPYTLPAVNTADVVLSAGSGENAWVYDIYHRTQD